MRRLFPHPADDVSVEEACAARREPHADRPYVSLCMIASIDGATVVDGNSRGLGGPTDQQLLLTLRRFADLVLVGAGTVRADGYGPPKLPGQRLAIVSRSARFDFAAPLFQSDRVLLVLPEDAPEVPVPSVRAGKGAVDLTAALPLLGARVVQAEGGPSVNARLAEAGLLDEVNLTLSPMLVGGDAPRVLDGAASTVQPMRLAQVCEADDGFVFLRYVRP